MMHAPSTPAQAHHLLLGAELVAQQLLDLIEDAIDLSGFLWIDVGNEILDGQPVSPWTDRIQGRAATNTGANRPTGQANAGTGRVAVLGNGTDQDLDFGSIPATGAVFVGVLFQDPLTSTAALVGGDSGMNRLLVETDGSVVLRADAGGSLTIAVAGTITADTPSMLVVRRDGANDVTCRLNGVDVTDGTPNRAGTFDAVHLMSHGTGDFMTGPLHSVILNPSDDLAGKEAQIESLWNQFHNNVIALP